MRTYRLPLALGCAVLAVAAQPLAAATLTVTGQMDRTVDRQSIQDALDAAAPGDTILLTGTFLLDGERIYLSKSGTTLAGEAVDNDGDGRVNEDWSDGVDNDADGFIDEDDWDAVLEGLAHPDGTPLDDGALDYFYNRALAVEGLSGPVRDLTIRDLKLSTFDRGINLFPDWVWATKRCEDIAPTAGTLADVVIEGNWFDNSYRNVVLHSATRGVQVRNNLMTGSLSGSILLIGQEYGCIQADGTDLFFPIDLPTDNDFADNEIITEPGTFGVLSIFTRRTSVHGNTVDGAYLGIYSASDDGARIVANEVRGGTLGILVGGSEKTLVLRNEVGGALIGLYGELPSAGSRFTDNVVADSVLWGLLLDYYASGATAVNNQFTGSGLVDVYLTSTTSGNTIVATDFATTVLDEGEGNTLIGTLAPDHR